MSVCNNKQEEIAELLSRQGIYNGQPEKCILFPVAVLKF
jgi:hypothetical protein